MAGDWIKMRVDLATDPAVISVSCALGITEFEVVGMLHHFWSWADAQSRDGHAAGVTKAWVDRYVHHAGFADQLENVGWLECSGSGIDIPNFDRHNGASAKSRGLAANRQQNRREKTSRTERDNSVTREEKRREEIDIPPLIPPAEKPSAKKSKIPSPFLVTGEMRAWAAESAPGVDLKTETEKFVDYWRGEAKTKADWPATWRNWMRKAQQDHNRPGPRGGAPVNRQQQIEDESARVVREIAEREERRRRQETGQAPIDLGDVIAVDGEVIHAD